MDSKFLNTIRGLLLAVAFVIVNLPITFAIAADPSWQAVNTQVPVGKSVRIELMLVGIDPRAHGHQGDRNANRYGA
jgi:hypothetical protein